jgi:carboxypeptidase C (cathepsin A)
LRSGEPILAILAGIEETQAWDYGGKSPFSDWPYASLVSRVMAASPHFRIMIANGDYDTQTTIGAAAYLVTQADWPRDRTELRFYEGGHMAYTKGATATRFANDIRAFVRQSR